MIAGDVLTSAPGEDIDQDCPVLRQRAQVGCVELEQKGKKDCCRSIQSLLNQDFGKVAEAMGFGAGPSARQHELVWLQCAAVARTARGPRCQCSRLSDEELRDASRFTAPEAV